MDQVNGRISCELACVDPVHVEILWPYVEPLIKAAAEKQNLSDLGVVKHDLFNGGALLWIAWSDYKVMAAAVTQCALANGDKYCTITACGGQDSAEWIRLVVGLETYAKRESCQLTYHWACWLETHVAGIQRNRPYSEGTL